MLGIAGRLHSEELELELEQYKCIYIDPDIM